MRRLAALATVLFTLTSTIARTSEIRVPAPAPMPIDVSRGRRSINRSDSAAVGVSAGMRRRLVEATARRPRTRAWRPSSLPNSVFDSPAARHPGMPSRHSMSSALISPRRTKR